MTKKKDEKNRYEYNDSLEFYYRHYHVFNPIKHQARAMSFPFHLDTEMNIKISPPGHFVYIAARIIFNLIGPNIALFLFLFAWPCNCVLGCVFLWDLPQERNAFLPNQLLYPLTNVM